MKTVMSFSNGKNVYKDKTQNDVQDKEMTDYDKGKKILQENPTKIERESSDRVDALKNRYANSIKTDRAKDEMDGITDALKFKKQYQNADDPHHHIGLTAFRNNGYDFVEVAKSCIKNRIAASGSKDNNSNYERDILNAVGTTGTEYSVVNKLKNEIKARWSDFGYSKDDSIVDDFIVKNRLSTADLCQKRIQNVINRYNKQLEDRIRNSVPSSGQQARVDLKNEMEAEDAARTDKQVIEAGKKTVAQ